MRTAFRPWASVLAPMLLAASALAASAVAEPQLRVGLNFTGSTYGIDSGAIPPDTNGAVGRRHIVQLLNDHYAVFRKKDGARVQLLSTSQFWADAGAVVRGGQTDPRVLYDPSSRRWYASMFSINSGIPDDLLVAVSRDADPTHGWAGFTIPFAGPVSIFADFPTLGFNRDAVFLYSNGTVLVLPKADLLASSPSVARATLVQSRDLLAPTGSKLQPIVDLDNGGMPEPLIAPWTLDSSQFRRWSIAGDVTAPVLDGTADLIALTPYEGLGNQGALQAQSGIGVNTSSTILASSVVLRNGVMWGVQTVAHQGRAALRWFAIEARSNKLLQEGLITDPAHDVFMGSIAVNPCDDVVIGFNQSGPDQFVGAYAVAGTTSGGVTTFGEPLLLQAGAARYEQTGGAPVARWGDYSTTVVDPVHPRRFWTFQEWPSAQDVWSTRITQLQLHKAGHPAWRGKDDDGEDHEDKDETRHSHGDRGGPKSMCGVG